ncbi:helix-turn-helix transcriptional regulator [Aerococcaceae bacterium DSM 111022]|nr:helix-turn-helix transcriptional regulator [Aerococcaceae bacterium DSM 111022]
MSAVTEHNKPYFGLMDIMKRKRITQEQLANTLGMDRATFNVKINRTNGRDFTFSEAMKIAVELQEVAEKFF